MGARGGLSALHRHCPGAAVLIVTLVITTIPGQVYALPSDWTVEGGSADFEQSDPQTLQITASDQAIVGFKTFDIGASETVQLHQPSSTSSFLSRVSGGTYSELAGTLITNGRFFLVNPAGIHIADTARIQAATFVASSLNITNADFLEGRLHFDRIPGQIPAAVVNEGSIRVDSNGLVALLGGAVANHGSILAQTGSVALAAGNKITLTFDPENQWALSIDEPLNQIATGLDGQPVSSAVEQTGTLFAPGGQVLVKADALEGLFDQVVNQEGLIEAVSVVERNGRITLVGEGGTLDQAGILRVDGSAQAPDAGSVFLSGTRIVQRGTLSANAADGGQAGQIRVIGTENTLLAEGSLLEAKSSSPDGRGGDIRVNTIQGNTDMRAGSQINVSGGSISGDAGFIDVSAAQQLGFHGQLIGTAAPGYLGGRVTFDPLNINISNSGASAVDGGDAPVGTPDEQFTESAGSTLSFDPRSGKAFTGFHEIYLQATRDININSPWDLNASVGPTGIPNLILEAQRNIAVNQNLSATNGNITLRANNNVTLASNRSITVGGSGAIQITADSDDNGTGTFVQGLNSSIGTAGGNITLRGSTAMTLRTINAGSGDVSVTATHGANIVDDNNNSTKVTANLLTLNAGGGIGTSGTTGQIDTHVHALNVTAGNGSIFLSNDQSLGVNNATASGAGNDITLSTSAGDLTLGTLTAADDLTLSAAGSVLSSNSLVTGDLLTVTAGTHIGSAGSPIRTSINSWVLNAAGGSAHVQTQSGSLTLNTQTVASGVATFGTSKGNIKVSAASGDLTLQTASGNITSTPILILNSGNLALKASGNLSINGDITTSGTVNAIATTGNLIVKSISATGGVNLSALSGSVLDGNGSAVNLTASGPSSVIAGGVIGTLADPIEVSVTGASLGVSPGSQLGGVSADLSGTVTPSGTLDVLNTPPGQVIFNGNVLFPPPAPPPVPVPPPAPIPPPTSAPAPSPLPVIAPTGLLPPVDFRNFFGQVLSGFFSSERQQRLRAVAG